LFAALQGRQARLQRRPRRVAAPRVLVPLVPARRFLRVRRGRVDRHHGRPGARVGVLTGVNGHGREAVASGVPGHVRFLLLQRITIPRPTADQGNVYPDATMANPDGDTVLTPRLRTMQIILLALVGGVVTFLVIAVVYRSQGNAPAPAAPVVTYVALAYAAL